MGEVRTVKGANCEEDIGLAAEAVLRAEHGPCVVFEDIPGCPKRLPPAAEHVCRHAPQHDARLSRSSHQMGAERRLSRGLPPGTAHHAARDRRGWPGAREHHDGRRRRRHQVPGAEMAREGRRPLYRHRHLQHHPRSGGELAQCRRLSRPGARQENCRHRHGSRPSRPHPPRQVIRARRAAAGGDGARRRSARLLLRRAGGALRRVRARPRRRAARPAGEDGARQGDRAAVPGQCRDRAGRLCAAGPHAMRKARSASGPATMPAACAQSRCSTSRRSTIATIRSCWACRRWARARTRWRAIAP